MIRKFSPYQLGLVVSFCCAILARNQPLMAQERQEATYIPMRFVDTSGDSMYFGHITVAKVWRDEWLLIRDESDGKVHLADTRNLTVIQIGEDGDGPGEYRYAMNFYTQEDTLIINHDGQNESEFLLPSGEFLSRTILYISPQYLTNQVWISPTQFISQCRPRVQRKEWLFGRFSADAELLQAYGEWDFVERYDGSASLQGTMNSGYMGVLPTGDIIFLYGCQPRMLVFHIAGELKQEYSLDMPWNDRNYTNPAHSRQYGYATRGFIYSMQIIDDGILVACRGFKRREGIMKNIVAVYSWTGELLRVITLPSVPERNSTEDFITGAFEVQGTILVTVMGDPAVRRLTITSRQPN